MKTERSQVQSAEPLETATSEEDKDYDSTSSLAQDFLLFQTRHYE